MQVVIFFFSGTGNTWWCAREISQHLRNTGHGCSMVSIEQSSAAETAEQVRHADIVGIGYPVYGSDLPQAMKDFLKTALLRTGVPVRKLFVFCTQLLFSGDGAHVYERELNAGGWCITWSAHFRMPNNICVTALPFPYTTDQRKIDRRLAVTGKAVARFARAVCEVRQVHKGAGIGPRFLGRMQRDPYRKWFSSLRNDISIDQELCVRCGRCAAICPSGNLFVTEEGKIGSRGTCILCVRCYNYCPVQAVIYRGRRHKARRGIPYRGPVPEFRPELISGMQK